MTGTTLIDRALLRIGGEDARDFLQGLVTQDVVKLDENAPRWAGLLTPQGKVLFDFILWAAPTPESASDVLIDCEAEQADALARRLTMYRLRRKVTIERERELAVHWTPQPMDTPFDPRLRALGHRWLEPAGKASEDHARAWRAFRLGHGVLEGAEELGQDKTLWLECNAEELGGVAYDKGCYVGQENTARMHYRSKVNRRLVAVPLDRADESRQRLALPDYGVSIEHRRVEDLAGLELPPWLAEAVNSRETEA